MAATRSSRRIAEKAAAVIELSSDSEPEAPEAVEIEDSEDEKEIEPAVSTPNANTQPLLKAPGIKYKTDHSEQKDSPSDSKVAVRVRDTGSAKHRHVNIEIPLPTSSVLRRKKGEAPASQDGNEDEVFKTPMERRHITLEESDHDEFVTPREGPASNPLDSSIARLAKANEGTSKDEEGEEEESDDDAPPEAVSTRDAEAETLKAAKAIEKAAKQQAAALKRKRQERDAFLKQQAEDRKRSQKTADLDEEAVVPMPMQVEEKTREVPKLLPLELLESDDEDEAPQQHSTPAMGQSKRRKLGGAEKLLAGPKLPKDKRLGSTAYRVVKGKGNARLAPPARKQAVNLKEALLRRDRVAQARGGFFVKKR
ncbi:hypothetical protein VTK26DRAFT_5219 [Humicola hyalothermophila]